MGATALDQAKNAESANVAPKKTLTARVSRNRDSGKRAILSTGEEYDGQKDAIDSYHECLKAVRERVAKGGETWTPK